MPSRGPNGRRNGSTQPTSTPGHSGGAVPESHRSSLFARRGRGPEPGHQSQGAECRERATNVNQNGRSRAARRVFHAAPSARQTLTVAGEKASILEGGAASRRTPCAVGTHRNPDATRTRKCRRRKNLGGVQARLPKSPIAHVSPGASLCPSGNQGAAATCDPSSHGMARQACRRKFVDHNLGVTASRAGRTHR